MSDVRRLEEQEQLCAYYGKASLKGRVFFLSKDWDSLLAEERSRTLAPFVLVKRDLGMDERSTLPCFDVTIYEPA